MGFDIFFSNILSTWSLVSFFLFLWFFLFCLLVILDWWRISYLICHVDISCAFDFIEFIITDDTQYSDKNWSCRFDRSLWFRATRMSDWFILCSITIFYELFPIYESSIHFLTFDWLFSQLFTFIFTISYFNHHYYTHYVFFCCIFLNLFTRNASFIILTLFWKSYGYTRCTVPLLTGRFLNKLDLAIPRSIHNSS